MAVGEPAIAGDKGFQESKESRSCAFYGELWWWTSNG